MKAAWCRTKAAPSGEKPGSTQSHVLTGCMLQSMVNFIPLLHPASYVGIRCLENGELLMVLCRDATGAHLFVLANGAIGWVQEHWLPDMRRITH